MQIIPFGNTGMSTSRIGIGLAALGRPGYINLGHGNDLEAGHTIEKMESHALKILDIAYGLGIRYFDMARSYGKAEAFFSAWIKKSVPPFNDVIAGSKWGYTYTADWKVQADKHEVKEHTLQLLDKQWPESIQLLGKYLRIYHIHSATPESRVLEDKAVLDKLWELKKRGTIVGLSLSGPAQQQTLSKALTISKGKEHLFQSVQLTWNVLEQSCTEVIQHAVTKGCGLIIKETLANGRLTERNTDPEFSFKKKIVQAIAERHQVGIDAIGIAYILHQPWAHVVLSGAATSGQLISNVKAAQVHLSEEEVSTLKSMAEPSENYWQKRSQLVWN
jgi:aryl-alcohol dehydrogenase-like predicted oxidoreductase